jgi:hypothetical protein
MPWPYPRIRKRISSRRFKCRRRGLHKKLFTRKSLEELMRLQPFRKILERNKKAMEEESVP